MHILFLIVVVMGLVTFSALCSGLNIALMSLDLGDLRRKAKLGNAHARRVLPLRKKTHLVLAGILLTNVATVSATSLFLESAFNGWIAGIASTLLIVIFGEILPQAVFARRALAFCSRLAPLLQLMVICTYPISKPLQLLLDKLFSQESIALQSRHELGIMISEHVGNTESELDNDEVEIIRGALQLSEKRARDIMQPMSSVYWLTPDTVLSPAKIDELKLMGWSRIPIFNRRQTTCFGVLLMKDLVDVDFSKEQLRVDDMPLYPTHMIGSMTALDTLFRKFIGGGAHLIPIERDDVIVGIATIEDLLEEIVGHEIEDETDRVKQRTSPSTHEG